MEQAGLKTLCGWSGAEVELIVGGGDHSLQTGEVCNQVDHSFRHRTLHSQCTASQRKPSSWKDEPAQKALLSATLMCGMSEVSKIISCLAAHRHVSCSLWGRLSWRKGLVTLSVHIYTTDSCALLPVCLLGWTLAAALPHGTGQSWPFLAGTRLCLVPGLASLTISSCAQRCSKGPSGSLCKGKEGICCPMPVVQRAFPSSSGLCPRSRCACFQFPSLGCQAVRVQASKYLLSRDKCTTSADSSCGKGQCGWLPVCPLGKWTLSYLEGKRRSFVVYQFSICLGTLFSPSLTHSHDDEGCCRVYAFVQWDCARHKPSRLGRRWMGSCGMVCADRSSLGQHMSPPRAWLLPQGSMGKRKIFSVMISSAFPLPLAVTSTGPAQLLSSLSLSLPYPSSCLSVFLQHMAWAGVRRAQTSKQPDSCKICLVYL